VESIVHLFVTKKKKVIATCGIHEGKGGSKQDMKFSVYQVQALLFKLTYNCEVLTEQIQKLQRRYTLLDANRETLTREIQRLQRRCAKLEHKLKQSEDSWNALLTLSNLQLGLASEKNAEFKMHANRVLNNLKKDFDERIDNTEKEKQRLLKIIKSAEKKAEAALAILEQTPPL